MSCGLRIDDVGFGFRIVDCRCGWWIVGCELWNVD